MQVAAIDIEEKALAWPARARAIAVVDAASYEVAATDLLAIKALRNEIEQTFGPIIAAAHDAHREAIAQRRRHEDPLTEAEKILRESMTRWQMDELARKDAETRRLREEAERQAAELREQEIEEAEAEGASVEEVRAIAERPLDVAPIVAANPIPKIAGISKPREYWRARVENFPLLVKHVATNPQYTNLLSVNETALRQLAEALKATLNLPGVVVYKTSGVSVSAK